MCYRVVLPHVRRERSPIGSGGEHRVRPRVPEETAHVELEHVEPLRFRVQGSGSRVQGSGFRVQGSGFRVSDFWFWVSGFGSPVSGAGASSSPSKYQ
jgi:hypothetical protein